MRNFGRHLDAVRTDAMLRSGIDFFCERAVDWHVQERFEVCNIRFGVGDADVVLVVSDRIDPEVLLVELDARVERGDEVLHHFHLSQTHVRRLGPVHIDNIFGVVQALDDAAVDHAVDLAHLGLDVLGYIVGLVEVFAR